MVPESCPCVWYHRDTQRAALPALDMDPAAQPWTVGTRPAGPCGTQRGSGRRDLVNQGFPAGRQRTADTGGNWLLAPTSTANSPATTARRPESSARMRPQHGRAEPALRGGLWLQSPAPSRSTWPKGEFVYKTAFLLSVPMQLHTHWLVTHSEYSCGSCSNYSHSTPS